MYGMSKNKIEKNIWSESAISFMSVVHTSQKRVLHPKLASLINQQTPKFLLDYGCGDGRILKDIQESITIDVHDINQEMLDLAKLKAGDIIRSYYQQKSEIPDNSYDAVLLSMVLVCIDNEAEYLRILKKIKSAKSETGRVYIAVTHPCFRDRGFSNFETSFCKEKSFKYLKDGEPFDVYIEDEMPPSVAFTDFHWSLAFTFNKICEAGLSVERVIETSDDKDHKECNNLHSPYLLIIAK